VAIVSSPWLPAIVLPALATGMSLLPAVAPGPADTTTSAVLGSCWSVSATSPLPPVPVTTLPLGSWPGVALA
jgi:hypothetical protein